MARSSKASMFCESDDDGQYVADLAADIYDVSVEADGFKKAERKSIRVGHQGRSHVDFVLEPILFLPGAKTVAGQGARPHEDQSSPLVELRDKRRVHLVAILPGNVIDARQAQDEAGYARAVIAEVFNQDARKTRRVRDAYQDLADQLKKYAKRYRSLDLVERPEDADFLLIFYEVARLRVVESFFGIDTSRNYSLGLLLVVTIGSAEKPEPRVVVRTEEPLSAEYVIKAFIRELKIVRREK